MGRSLVVLLRRASTPRVARNRTMRWTDTAWMKYIYTMQNLTFGSDGGLTAACQAKHPTEPHLCFMSPHMQVRKPFHFWPRRSTAVSEGCLEGFLCERLQLEMGARSLPSCTRLRCER